MIVFTNWEQYNWQDVIITTGMFDGVHAGHRKLIGKVVGRAKQENKKSVLVTFEPHPRFVLKQDDSFKLLTSYSERIKLLASTGLDGLVILPFTKDLATLSSTDFIKNVLVDKVRISHYIVGYDHRFGKDREGSVEKVKQLAKDCNFTFEQVDSLDEGDFPVSSSRIRNLIISGKVNEANEFLGYNYLLAGTVVKGAQIGRKLGFPTANVAPENKSKLIPKLGVYAVYVDVEATRYLGMLNIGIRPTVNSSYEFPTVEVHILNFKGDLYGNKVTLEFLSFIREEQKFNGLEELKSQLELDKQLVKEQFSL